MSRAPGRKGGKRRKNSSDRNARNAAYMNLAEKLAAVFGSGVYTKDELQSAVCSYVADMKNAGETGDNVIEAAQRLVTEVGARFPVSSRTQVILADMVSWCLAEYYRESA